MIIYLTAVSHTMTGNAVGGKRAKGNPTSINKLLTGFTRRGGEETSIDDLYERTHSDNDTCFLYVPGLTF